ncbi:MAG: hypothetical protein U5R31_04810 [Acidimicrobiia bacterium]|nr:hypothetical protein [Acidimicrobiia bacterium]
MSIGSDGTGSIGGRIDDRYVAVDFQFVSADSDPPYGGSDPGQERVWRPDI